MTNPDTSAGKSVWDAARVYLTWNITRNKGGDVDTARVYAAEVTGDYDIDASVTREPPQADLTLSTEAPVPLINWIRSTPQTDLTLDTKAPTIAGGTWKADVNTTISDVAVG